VTLPSFSFAPTNCGVTSLTETLTYPTFANNPTAIFTYDSTSRLFKINTDQTTAVGTYTA